MSLATIMNAIVLEGNRPSFRSGLPLPNLERRKVLLKTKHVAARMADWLVLEYKSVPEGSILGADVVGEIVQLGEGVDSMQFQIGDNVHGFVHDASHRTPDNGGFAQYVSLDSKLAFKLGGKVTFSGKETLSEGPIDTFEGAATVSASWLTIAATPFHYMKPKLEWEPTKPQIE